MKILMTSVVDLRNSQHNRPHEFVRYLSEKNDITFLSVNDRWKGKQGNLEEYNREFNDILNKIRYLYLSDRQSSIIAQELFSRRTLKGVMKEDFDVHLNHDGLFVGLKASKKLATVMDLADDLPAMIGESPQIPRLLRPLGGMLGNVIIKKNIKRARYVTLSTDQLRGIYNIPKERTRIIPNGVDVDMFKNYGDTRNEFKLHGFNIGYIGVLREWVNLEPLFKALRSLDPEIRVVIVGKEGRYAENMALAERCGVSNRVDFVGMIPYKDIPRYICSMDICVIPFEVNAIANSSIPLKLFEYMACEKPVVSTEINGVKSIAGNSLLYAGKESEWVDAIRKLYENQELRKVLGKQGRRIVEERYSWKRITTELESVLHEAAGMTT